MVEDRQAAERAEWHDVLMRLAGWLSDDDLARARELLADGRLDEVGNVVAEAIDGGLVPYSEEVAARLRRLLAAHGDPSLVEAGVRRRMEAPPCDFAPVPPWGVGPSVVDEVDRAAIEAASGSGVTTLRRAWRYPATALQVHRRVYLAETPADADPARIAGALQRALAGAGEVAPQVEAYATGAALPEYQLLAVSRAETLWPQSGA